MKITITSNLVDEKKWIKGERSGVIRTQTATAETRRWRREIRLDLGKAEPFAAGEYTVDAEEILDVGDFGDLKIVRRLPLVAVKPALAKAS